MADIFNNINELLLQIKREDIMNEIPSFTSNKPEDSFAQLLISKNPYISGFSIDNKERPTTATSHKEIEIEVVDDDFDDDDDKDDYSTKKKVFLIEKVKKRNRKIGRINKEDKDNYYGKHDKFKDDNIIKKFKVHLHESIYNYLNHSHQNSTNGKKKVFLYRIDTNEIKNTNKSASKEWFKKKLRDVFSCKLSKKCSTKGELYNKIKIEKIFSEGKNKEMMEILEKTVRNMYNSYINDEKIEGFKTLKDDIEELKQEMKAKGEEEKLIDDYIKKYIHTALNFEEILSKKTERNKKKKINIIIDE
jgi:hypothetical protein